MKKISTLLFIITVLTFVSHAQSTTKNILFLLPMKSQEISAMEVSRFQDQHDINQVFATTLVGFWEGAQIALDELSDEGYAVNVIVRDITDNVDILQNLLNNNYLPQNIDLIIAPVYGKMFPYIAAYAKEHKIPTVNPFAKKSDIIEGNPYIYKLYPAAQARAQYIAEHYPNSNIILWQSPRPLKNNNEEEDYETYFTEHNIPFHKIMDTTTIANHLSSTQNNIVISCKTGQNSYRYSINKILNAQKLHSFTWIIPEDWLQSSEINFDNLAGLDVAFFTNYFVNKRSEKVEIFTYKFIDRFHNIPETETFAFQGYDVTNFFIRLICNDFNIPQNIVPLSYEFQMQNVLQGGYENMKTRYIKMENLNLHEVRE